MQTYLVLAKFNREGNMNVGLMGERFAALRKNYERFGGKILHAYGTLGEYDMVVIAQAPDADSMKKIDVAGKLPGMVETTTIPLLPFDHFMTLIQEVVSSSS